MYGIDVSEFQDKKIALVLSGGVVKAAAWHLGVALALEDIGFTLKHNNSPKSSLEIGTYVGSSAGALINLYFAAGFRPMEIIDATIQGRSTKLRPFTYRDMLCLKKTMEKPPKTDIYDPFDGLPLVWRKILSPIRNISGLFTTKGLYEYIIENLLQGNNFEDLSADLFVTATQLDHSRKMIFSKYNYPNPNHDRTAIYQTGVPIADAVAASMSVPPFYAPYPIRNPESGRVNYYIDGEIRETLSTHVAVDNSCDFIISSWTHTPYHYHDEIGSLVNYGLPAICVQSIYLLIQKKIVASRARFNTAKDIIDTVNEYMVSNKVDSLHRKKIMSILERKLNYKDNVKLIDIYPNHRNYKLFLRNSFSLDPKKTSEIVKMGYKRAMTVIAKREWEN